MVQHRACFLERGAEIEVHPDLAFVVEKGRSSGFGVLFRARARYRHRDTVTSLKSRGGSYEEWS